MQAMAAENALSETAFIKANTGPEDRWQIRWFTPAVEVDLCGHATLASGHVVLSHLSPHVDTVRFSGAVGDLRVDRTDAGYRMALPRRDASPCSPTPGMLEALGLGVVGSGPSDDLVVQVLGAEMYMVVVRDETTVARLDPDMAGLMHLDRDGVIVTAPADDAETDFVSRYFVPAAGIPEDPVTGSAHCQLAPYWAERLGKTTLRARQISARGGVLGCELHDDRVELLGQCVDYMQGTVSYDATTE